VADERAAEYLRIQTITVPVADLDRSLEFYQTRLGFKILQQMSLPGGMRVALVSPSQGSALLILSDADPDHRLGSTTGVSLLTDNLDALHREWSARGVQFTQEPQPAPWTAEPSPWGARQATFLDLDSNAFHLVEADVISQRLELERKAAAEKADRERRAAQELAIATQVQAGLFPRSRPAITTLNYEGVCLQARQVGGDYFDFLDFGHGRLGFVVGDVSGKGLGAALLMANLQAHIRGQFALYAHDLAGLLSSVNRLFTQSAPAASYATLFFAAYDDLTRRLRFVNCGHPPPLLVRRTGVVEHLDTTSWAIGMFDEWTGSSREVQLAAGDVLALYTDGVTETVNAQGEEFGAMRLTNALTISTGATARELLDRIISDVQRFGQADQADDITMVVARCI
jgi:serine phosphatase RsbU (regulator of sigma subunit)